jgi:hypothetical protein
MMDVMIHSTNELLPLDGLPWMVAYDRQFPDVRAYGHTATQAFTRLAQRLEDDAPLFPDQTDAMNAIAAELWSRLGGAT